MWSNYWFIIIFALFGNAGTVEMKELMPICFNKANPDQWKLMLKVIHSENKKRVLRDANKLQQSDIVALFSLYSQVNQSTGGRLVYVSKIRDALVSLHIDSDILESKLDEVVKDGTKEMNESEFVRFVRKCIEEGENRMKNAGSVANC